MSFAPAFKYLRSTFRGMCVLGLIALVADPAMAIRSDDTKDFTWILVFSGMLAFFAAFGIGANDVANAFATSVGAKSLTIRQAVVLAAIFEFLGAVLMGSSVAKTIRKGIADPDCFEDNPGLLMYGMTIVILAVAVWLALASYLEMPVSTTHSAVGGIIGMTMMVRGSDCVVWNEESDDFPYIKGVAAIVASWVLSPVVSGFCAAVLYGITKYVIIHDRESAFFRSKISFPFIVAFTCGVNTAFIILKGSKGKKDEWGTEDIYDNAKDGDGSKLAAVCAIVFGVTFVLTAAATPKLASLVEERVPEGELYNPAKDYDKITPQDETKTEKDAENGVVAYVNREMETDPHAVLNDNELVSSIHQNAQVYDARAEEMFKYVQVFTAIVDSFSHGANDIANAMGPFAAVYITWKNNEVESKQDIGDDMYWILAIGGVGIVVGLATYGYKVISAIGVKLTAITPSRGYCIELGAAFVIIYGTTQGWPLSTTHCQVGATVGVGLFEGLKGINGWVLGKTVMGWVITLLVVGMSAALLVGPNPESTCPSA